MAEGGALMAGKKAADITLKPAEQEKVICLLVESTLEDILHDILLDVHREEKTARTISAVIELQQKAEKLKLQPSGNPENGSTDPDLFIETNAAQLKGNIISLKGNPLKTVKKILCPSCRLPRLLYPRVGFNSRPVPDPGQQYCKNEPPIILDKHDVHGQRKKGVKMKGQAKPKNKKKTEPGSPASSEPSQDAVPTPTSNVFPTAESFDFKEIEYPAAKCPNKDSHLGDHWKSVNVFATHLNGSCYLKRDRAAGREAVAKISAGTPRDSRASSPNPSSKVVNGAKRARGPDDDSDGKVVKKKQKLESTPKKGKGGGALGPSKLREETSNDNINGEIEDLDGDTVEIRSEFVDGPNPATENGGGGGGAVEQVKLKLSLTGTTARKKIEKNKLKKRLAVTTAAD